jgi:nucleoside permease NupC
VTCLEILLKHIEILGVMVAKVGVNKGKVQEQRKEESLMSLKTKIKSYSYCE